MIIYFEKEKDSLIILSFHSDFCKWASCNASDRTFQQLFTEEIQHRSGLFRRHTWRGRGRNVLSQCEWRRASYSLLMISDVSYNYSSPVHCWSTSITIKIDSTIVSFRRSSAKRSWTIIFGRTSLSGLGMSLHDWIVPGKRNSVELLNPSFSFQAEEMVV